MKFGKFHQMIRQEKKNRKQSWFHLLPELIKESTRRRYKKIDWISRACDYQMNAATEDKESWS